MSPLERIDTNSSSSNTPAGLHTEKILVKIATVNVTTGGGTAVPAKTTPGTDRTTTNRPERRRGRRKSPTSTNSIGGSTHGNGIGGRGTGTGTTGVARRMTKKLADVTRTSRRKPRRVNGSAADRGRGKCDCLGLLSGIKLFFYDDDTLKKIGCEY